MGQPEVSRATVPSVALSVGEGKLVNQTVMLADGRVFNLGRPNTRRHARRLRKYVRIRLRNEPEFYAAFGHEYTKRGRHV